MLNIGDNMWRDGASGSGIRPGGQAPPPPPNNAWVTPPDIPAMGRRPAGEANPAGNGAGQQEEDEVRRRSKFSLKLAENLATSVLEDPHVRKIGGEIARMQLVSVGCILWG